jgi:hypothetical protein
MTDDNLRSTTKMKTWSTTEVGCIVASLAALGMAMVVLRLQQNATRKQDSEEDDDDDDYDWNDDDDETKAFPWEPKSNQHSSYSFREKSNLNHRQEQKELDFFSSMTFAGGGLRAPNCLCCL